MGGQKIRNFVYTDSLQSLSRRESCIPCMEVNQEDLWLLDMICAI